MSEVKLLVHAFDTPFDAYEAFSCCTISHLCSCLLPGTMDMIQLPSFSVPFV